MINAMLHAFGLQRRQNAAPTPTTGRSSSGLAPQAEAQTTAVVQFGLGMYTRAFAAAAVAPALPALTPRTLAMLAYDLILTGNAVFQVAVVDGALALRRAIQYTVEGGIDPASWTYRLTLESPSGSAGVIEPYENVVHARLPGPQPHRGVSPLVAAGISVSLMAKIEASLEREMNAYNAMLVAHPDGAVPQSQDERAKFGRQIVDAEGRALLVQDGGTGGWNRTGGGSWSQVRLGPEPNPNEVSLRSQISQDILSTLGIPAGLYAPREGAVSRESYREFYANGIKPYARYIEDEVGRKTNTPIAITFPRLAAADVAARARAYKALLDAGMSEDEARLHAGLME